MRISGPDGLPPRGAHEAAKADAKIAGSAGRSTPTAAPDAELLSSYRPYIEKADQVAEMDLHAIADAKALLASGELDSPQAVRRAAETILNLGI